MRFLILSIAVVLISNFCAAQEKYASYEMSYFNGSKFPTSYDIKATEPKDGVTIFHISVFSVFENSTGKKIELVMNSIKLERFKTLLDSVKGKFNEYMKIAKSNNVKDFKKDIEMPDLSIICTWYYGNMVDRDVELVAKFSVDDRGSISLIIQNKDNLQDTSGSTGSLRRFWLAFKTPKEIDTFLSKISLEKVNEFYSNKKGKEDLFNK